MGLGLTSIIQIFMHIDSDVKAKFAKGSGVNLVYFPGDHQDGLNILHYLCRLFT